MPEDTAAGVNSRSIRLALRVLGRGPGTLGEIRYACPAGFGRLQAAAAAEGLVAEGLALRFGPVGEDAVYALTVRGLERAAVCRGEKNATESMRKPMIWV